MKKTPAQTDLWLVLAFTLVFWFMAVTWNLSEHVEAYSRFYESIQLDEWPFSMLVLSLGLSWYSWRRSHEAKQEIQERTRSEERVQDLLRHNSDLAQRLYSAQEDERRALARELHDEMGQNCTAIRTEAAVISIGKLTVEEVQASAKRISQSAQHLSEMTRLMLQQLRPLVLDSMGLQEALKVLCMQWQQSSGVECQCEVATLPGDLSDYLSVTVYRLIQESLTNVAKHARATQVRVSVHTDSNGQLRLSVRDNGMGMCTSGAVPEGFGMLGMQERVASLKGRFDWHSMPGQGVHIAIELPLVTT
jgi:two-component system sensor histidine kinase UhpB